ncbi:MAG: hypothetical protein GEU76_04275 [Alphaproteobacteria bacterium]|jgi:hypothetical protein|nr:hypothetical protein [Alphaproteobacteria bacterium]
MEYQEVGMLVSRADAAHGVVDTGSSGGGNALLIMLGVAIAFGVGFSIYKRWRNRTQDGNGDAGS